MILHLPIIEQKMSWIISKTFHGYLGNTRRVEDLRRVTLNISSVSETILATAKQVGD